MKDFKNYKVDKSVMNSAKKMQYFCTVCREDQKLQIKLFIAKTQERGNKL